MAAAAASPGPSGPTTGPSASTPGPSASTPGPSAPTTGPSAPTTGPSASTPGPSDSTPGPGPSASTPGPSDSTPGSAAPGRRKRLNKNKKKSWNKHSDVREVEEFLEDVRLQERIVGGLVSEKTDDSLYFVDTGDDKKDLIHNKGKLKPLWVDLVLQSDSKVAVPKDILAHQIPNSRKLRKKADQEKRFGIVRRKERLLYARLKKPAVKTKPGANNNPSRGFYDLWSNTNPLDQELEGKEEWFLEQTKRKRPKRPIKQQQKPSQVSAIEVIAPGGSYNPTFESHQALLLAAHEVEVKKRRIEEKINRQVCLPPAAELPTQETVLQELCQGLLEESEGEEQEPDTHPSGNTEAAEGPVWNVFSCEKKTEKDRKREKIFKRQELRIKEQKQARERQQQLFRLRSIKGEVRQLELRRAEKKAERTEKRKVEANKPRRLGRLKYQDPDLDVKLSDELAGSLRALKPEGSILADRFKSLQKRNLIEPRQRAKFKRKHKLKYVEKRAFREITL
ncbi:ribosome biogenesis protein NOP53 isoform X2 [Amblyraja radiata]|uniref:ribosome biogenesis protein NOP53 isoform X2 n=1 Tax=Amblyraja radiata TaxID=386614 RepID=UPI0014037474|nr:ribosome biogenesis protein NOP53 isoform X2 [Amblyraja radiata]